MPLTLHRSHRLDRLAAALGAHLESAPLPPLEAERIVVASFGLQRWLSHRLAEQLGVAMNIAFQFPAEFITEVFAAISPKRAPSDVYGRDVLPWSIHAALPALLPEREFALLQNYTHGDALMRWHLAQQIAAVFDRYLAYRPDLLLRWEQGKVDDGERWQARLWQRIANGEAHGPALLREFAQQQRRPAAAESTFDDLPLFQAAPARPEPAATPLGRYSIFAPTTLPPFYLQVLEAIAPLADVHLYLLSPTQEYWGDVLSEREQGRMRRWMARKGANPEAHPFSKPHPLVASLGKIGREFQEAILDLSPAGEVDHFEPAEFPGTLLGALQRSILALDPSEERQAVAEGDRSLQIHNGHSPLREVEVLHDQLLALFAADPTLEPRDVLVAVTDMAAYAPCIEAVFDAPESDEVRFPFSIADRTARAENPVADALLRILALVESRYPASGVLGLLESEPIRARFEITESDLTLIRDWVSRSGIRWGIDEAQRAEHELPAIREHTWKFGLDRLVLGFALPRDGSELFHGILPDDDVEGDYATVLGRFASFCSVLFETGRTLAALEVTAAEWSTALLAALGSLCSGENRLAESYRSTTTRLAAIAESATKAGHTERLPFRVLHAHVTSLFSDDESGAGFLRGGVTFCSLKPMRAIPHRVIAVLGLNDAAFPRKGSAPAFDLAAANPMSGDRTLRDDDRYLFLETLLSVRDTLLLSYSGQSPKDNTPRPPSVLVAELLDHLERHFSPAPPHRTVAEQLTTVHCLQAFNPRYFARQPKLFSYSRENAAAAARALGPRTAAQPFAAVLPPPPIGDQVALAQVIQALTKSARFFAHQRLQLTLPFEQPSIEDSEPMELDGLDRYGISTQLVEAALAGRDPTSLLGAVVADGKLPHGYVGQNAFAEASSVAAVVTAAIAHHAPGTPLSPAHLSCTVGSWRLSGSLGPFTASALVRHRTANTHGGDLLAAWISHLALCLARPAGYPLRTAIIGTDGTCTFPALSAEEAGATLLPLLELSTRAHAEALPLFPKSSLAYAETLLARPDDPAAALTAAGAAWNGNSFQRTRGEADDEWNALLWREHPNPLGVDFQQLAMVVFGPLLQHLTEEGGGK